jgi:RecA-family ATPase
MARRRAAEAARQNGADVVDLQAARAERPKLDISLAAWVKRDLPEPDWLLGQWLSTTSRVMIVGPTGLGKTIFGIAVAMAIAADNGFLHWRGGRKGRVLYVDGEMSRQLMKRRLIDAARRAGHMPEGLTILSKEDFPEMPPLNTPTGQRWMNSLIAAYRPLDLIIFDNIQSLLVGDMKEEDQWAAMLPWVRDLTRRSIGQIWFHHTGHDETKSYGSKAREWQMDTVALMERLKDSDGELAFSLKFTKARERTPDNREDFEPVTMRLVEDQWVKGDAISAKQAKLTDRYRNALSALTSIVAERGEKLPPAWGLQPELRAVTLDATKAEWKARNVIKSDDKNDRTTFNRLVDALVSRGFAAMREGRIWPIIA